MFAWRAFLAHGEAEPGAYMTMPALERAGIVVSFFTRRGGVSSPPLSTLNLSFVAGDDPTSVSRNRARVSGALGSAPESWTAVRQVHGATVHVVERAGVGVGAEDGAQAPEADASVTDVPGATLAVLTADCLPLVLADVSRRRIAVVHAGWRGLVAGVIGRTVDAIGNPSTLIAGIGPSIGPCCYEVGDDVTDPAVAAFGEQVVRRPRDGGKSHLDLWRGARLALAAAGVREVGLVGLCTKCEPTRFFSHRAGDAGRQGVVAHLRSDG